MKDMVRREGVADRFEIASAAVSTEEIGNPVYPPAQRVLNEHGISCKGHHAHQMSRKEYEYYDYVILMDAMNRRWCDRIIGLVHRKLPGHLGRREPRMQSPAR